VSKHAGWSIGQQGQWITECHRPHAKKNQACNDSRGESRRRKTRVAPCREVVKLELMPAPWYMAPHRGREPRRFAYPRPERPSAGTAGSAIEVAEKGYEGSVSAKAKVKAGRFCTQ